VELRPARAEDLAAVHALIERAYARYIPRIGRRPAPMDDDHAAQIEAGQVTVLEGDGGDVILGVLVTELEADHIHVATVAVDPACHGRGMGRRLLAEAERLALVAGVGEVRLFTNEKMTENLVLYPHLGYRETGRRTQNGFCRVFFTKDL